MIVRRRLRGEGGNEGRGEGHVLNLNP
jgi:hypothetical protein